MNINLKSLQYLLFGVSIIQITAIAVLYQAIQTLHKTDLTQTPSRVRADATNSLPITPSVRERPVATLQNKPIEAKPAPVVNRLKLQNQCPKTDLFVSGISLEPTIADKSVHSFYLLETCPIYELITRGDLVLLNAPQSDKPLAKFVRAVPGDTISLVGWSEGFGTLQVNGEDVKTSKGDFYRIPVGRVPIMKLYIDAYKDGVPEGAYLLLGDNDNNSLDSTSFGLVSIKDIVGYAPAK